MLKIIEKYLHRIGVDYSLRNHNKAIDFEVEAPEGKWSCMLYLYGRSGIAFYSIVPFIVPTTWRTEMALYLMWLNNERVFGNFELDMETGEIRFKTYIDCESNHLESYANYYSSLSYLKFIY